MVYVVLLLLNFSHAAESAAPEVRQPPNYDALFHKPTDGATTDVEKELECIQSQTQNKQELIKSKGATEMIKHLAPVIQDGFNRFHVTPFERAVFYAQAIEESGAFTQMSESKKISATGNDPIGHVLNNDVNDASFKARKGATQSREFGPFRGRGPVQISRCDNYLSVIHYLNLMYAGKKPEWKRYWLDSNGKDEIGTVCDKKQLDAFAERYNNKYGMNANLYGTLDDQVRFAMVGAELTDPVSKKKISSEQFLVDASLAFWRGHCGEEVDNSSVPAKLAEYKHCAKFGSSDYMTQAAKCVTQCIKGSTLGWDRRKVWMERALLCGRL